MFRRFWKIDYCPRYLAHATGQGADQDRHGEMRLRRRRPVGPTAWHDSFWDIAVVGWACADDIPRNLVGSGFAALTVV